MATVTNLPQDDNRLVIVGATGSGKTIAGLWHLSMRNYHTMPWIVYDFKGDKNINGLPNIRHIGLDEIPIKPGVFVVHPKPEDEDDVEAHMRAIWERERIGVFVDEGLMLGNANRPFRALLTQGRSKTIPMITLSQRPVWMDRFVFSESEFFQIFRLQHRKDRRSVEEFVPGDIGKRLPRFHSYYYDVGSDDGIKVWAPVPPVDIIYQTFERRLKPAKPVL